MNRNSEVSFTAGDPFFTDHNTAWTRTPGTDRAVASAMAQGSTAIFKGLSARGVSIAYTYKLAGFRPHVMVYAPYLRICGETIESDDVPDDATDRDLAAIPEAVVSRRVLTNADIGVGRELGPDVNLVGPATVFAEGTPEALIIIPVGSHAGGTH